MLGRRSILLVVATLLVTSVAGVMLHHRQNAAGAIGGAISVPKLAWLFYTVFVWGFLCPILAFEPRVSRTFRVIVGSFAAIMWARFIVEIPMLYLWKIWRPPYGMAVDVATALVVVIGLIATRRTWWPHRHADGWMVAFSLALVVGAVIECVYAWLFDRAVAGATTGSHAVWFASARDPRFTFINRLTLAFDLVLYGFLVAFLTATFVPRRERKHGNNA